MVRAPGAISLTRSARTALSRGLHVPRALEWPAVLCELGRCGADTVAPSLEPLGTMPKVQPLGAGPRGMQIVREAGLPVALRSAWNFGPSPAVWVKSGHRAANQAAWWWRGRRADLSSPPPRGIAVRGKNPSGGKAARAFRPDANAALMRGGWAARNLTRGQVGRWRTMSAKGGPPGGDGNKDSLITLSTRLGFICRMIIHIYMVASRAAEERASMRSGRHECSVSLEWRVAS